jgi:hypothetical protein
MSVSNKLPGNARGDVYYLGRRIPFSLLGLAGGGDGRAGTSCDSFFSKFHRARRVHAVDVALVHGDDEQVVRIMRSKSAERGVDGAERRKRMSSREGGVGPSIKVVGKMIGVAEHKVVTWRQELNRDVSLIN